MYVAESTLDGPIEIGWVPAVSLTAATLGVLAIGLFSGPFIDAAIGAASCAAR